MIKHLRCILGIHKWKYYNTKYNERRKCVLCKRKQESYVNFAFPEYAGDEYYWSDI